MFANQGTVKVIVAQIYRCNCTVSHNVYVVPAGLACLIANVCLQQL